MSEIKIFSDLHVHGRYARACSKDLSIQNLEKYAKIKGVNLLGTGDCLHPQWLSEIKKDLTPDENGILWTKNKFPFMLQTELALFYTQGGKGRRVHYVVLIPNLEVLDQIIEALKKNYKLDYDGRPILGMSSIDFVEKMMSISKDIEIIPAHAWTSWMSIFGSKSGFDSIEECFEEKTKYIHAIETGLSCYDEKTEVLTENGWKRFSEVSQVDKICTLNHGTDEIEFQRPRKVFHSQYKGKMYRLKTKRADLLVTPNHNIYYAPCDFRTQRPYRLKEARELIGKSKILKKDGTWIGKNPKHFLLPSVKIRHGSRFYSGFRTKSMKKLPIRPWLKFFGFWIAEGWATNGKRGDYNVCVAVQKPKLRAEIIRILSELGYNIYSDEKIVRVRDYQLFSYLRRFGKAAEKFVPFEIKILSKELLEIFLEYYLKGDGHIYGRNGKGLSATTISTHLRDDLQEIALKIGISAYYKLHNRKGTPFMSPSQKRIYRQSADSWNIYFIRHNKHAIVPSVIKKYKYQERWVNYSGMVYCVSVPNRVIYIRRNGIPLWCGNSDPPMNRRVSFLDGITLVSFSDLHSYWPWRLGRELTIFELPELTYDNILNCIRKNNIVGTLEFFPEEGKYHYDGHRICNVSMEPKETKKYKGVCPKCGKEMTIGVLNRVEELADRPVGYTPNNATPFKSVIPLSEIISMTIGGSTFTRKVWDIYNPLIDKFGNELNVLLNVSRDEVVKVTSEKIADAIIKVREGKVRFKGGYDGVYGSPIFNDNEKSTKSFVDQKSLTDF